MEEIFNSIDFGTLIDSTLGLLVIIIAFYGRKMLRKISSKLPRRREYEIDEAVKRDVAVFDIVSEIRVMLDGCRSQLLVFHNGSFFSAHHPIWYVDCVVESARLGTTYNMQALQNVPSGALLDVLSPFWGKQISGCNRVDESILPGSGVFWYTVKELPEGNTKEMLKGHDVDNMLITSVINPKDNRIIGMLCIDFCEPIELPDNFNLIRNSALTISYKLSALERDEEK